MTFEPTSTQDIAEACAYLTEFGPFPQALASGLAANDPGAIRTAATHLSQAGRLGALRELVERFRFKREFAVWARVQSSRLHCESGDYSRALADIDDLMQRFPERAGAHWFVARSRCLIGLKREAEAEADLREAIRRFPAEAIPRGALANLLSRRRRADEALQVWRDLHVHVPSPDLGAFVGLAHALKAAGKREEALAALDEIGRRFPDDPRTPPLVAEAAEERGQGERALEIWRDFAERTAAANEPEAVIERARALVRLGRVDEAAQALEALLAREPEHAGALRDLATLYGELGEAASARDLRVRLLQRLGETAPPEAWAMLARVHHDLGDHAAGEATLAELERRFPDSALAENERLRLAKERETGHDELMRRVAAARARFPEDVELRSLWAWLLLSLGRLEEAEREVAALEAEAPAGVALAARLRLEVDHGDENLRRYLARLGETRAWSALDAIQAAYQLLEIRTPWAFDFGAALLADAAARNLGHVRLNGMRARFAIARQEDEAALELIDATPPRYRRRDALELRAWAAAKRGRDDEAKALWREAIAGNYYAAIHAPIQSLTRVSPDDRPPPGEGVTAYVVFRNEAALIPDFLAHHRRQGVRRFVFFDHMSCDGGREIALRERDVIVYECPDSYQLSWSGRRWINEVVAREGARGWGLQLDMDEHLIYPGCETVSLDRFVAYLDAHGFEAARGYMLDLFPPRLIGDDGEPPPLREHIWFDDDYVGFGLTRPPYLSPGGGVRARLFEAKEFLHKVPLWRLDAGLLVNSHETTHMRFADVSTALLHYKLMNVALRGREAGRARAGIDYLEADADVEAIRRHARYAARLNRLWRADLRAPGVSRPLEDSLSLAARGLMDMSDAYREWLNRA